MVKFIDEYKFDYYGFTTKFYDNTDFNGNPLGQENISYYQRSEELQSQTDRDDYAVTPSSSTTSSVFFATTSATSPVFFATFSAVSVRFFFKFIVIETRI